MAITTQYTNPIDLLRLILTYQLWGDNQQGYPSSQALITSGVGIEGSFDSTTLDPIRAINIAYQVTDFNSSSTKDLIAKICKQFNLIQYTNSNGFECVKYLFATTSDKPIQSFVIDDTTEFSQLTYPDQSTICINPTIKYGYDFALEDYTKELKIENVQMSAYDPAYTTGFDNNDSEDYWNLCKTKLYPLCKHAEEMDSSLSENDLIVDYSGAKFRLENIIKLMSFCRFEFTVPFVKGLNLKAGDIIAITFNHLSYAGNIEYKAVINSVSLSKSSNSCTISVMFLQELEQSLLTALQNTTNESNVSYQDTTDVNNLNINTSYEFDGLATLTYSDPLGQLCHITQINDDLATLTNEIDECQIGIVTDDINKPFMYTDDSKNIKWFATLTSGTNNYIPTFINNYGSLQNSNIIVNDNGIEILQTGSNNVGIKLGLWDIIRSQTSGTPLTINYNNTTFTSVDTNGTWTFNTVNDETPLKIASGQGFYLNIGGINVSNGSYYNPAIQVTPITGGIEIDGHYGSVVYVNRFSPGDVNLCYAGGKVSINKAVAHERLHVGGNILADGFIRAGNFTPLQSNYGLAWIGRSTDEPIGSLTVQLGGIYESTTFRVVDNECTKTIFSVSGLAPEASLNVNQYGTVNIGNNLAEPWRSDLKALQISTGLSLYGSSGFGSGYLVSNAYLNTAGQHIARYTGGSVVQGLEQDSFTWHIAPSVTAGNVLSYVEKMKLTSEWLYLYTNGLYNNGGYFQGLNNDRVNITAPAYTFLSVNACVDASTTTWKTLVTGVSSILEMGADGHLYIYQNAATTAGSQITIDPSPKIIWHSGNDGSGSGLDADLLDGYHLDQLTKSISNYGNLNLINSISNINSFYATLNGPMGNNRWYWSINACHSTGDTAWGGQIVWGMEASAYRNRMFFHSKEGSVWDDWTEILTNRLIGNRENWASYFSSTFVVGQLTWENYGNNHTIFDASRGYSPSGTAVNNSNSQVAWTPTYPTLMGWDGANTFGVRVDSARVADSSDLLDGYHGSNYLGKNGNAYYQANNWIEFTGEAPVGLYWSIGTRDAGGTARYSQINTNSTQTYGNLAIYGYKNNWAGIVFEHSNGKVTFMTRVADSFTGVYQQSNNSWQWYHDGNQFWINTAGGDGITCWGSQGNVNTISSTTNSNSQLQLQASGSSMRLQDQLILMAANVYIYESLTIGGSDGVSFGSSEGNFRLKQIGTQFCLQKVVSGVWVTVTILA